MNNQKNILLPGCHADELQLTVAGNIVKHLGVQMYAGRPVPAIAEFVSNAWDADATEVEIDIPLDTPWNPANEQQVITVSDNGNGMNWEMIRDAYLNVGRDRRKTEETDKSPGGRRLQGRKGVGKLAGFGIADTLEVQTIYKEKNHNLDELVLIWFRLDLADLARVEQGPAPVEVIFAGPVSESPCMGRTDKGTTIILRHLHERRAQNAIRFNHSLAHRFLLLPRFRVLLNNSDLHEEIGELHWRIPKGVDWESDNVTGCGPVEYWIGFTERPRKQNEGELSGILVYTRGKISQEETFFDISGGVTGQHGLRYMVGKVRAEWLDAGIDTQDHIATPRDSIAWESPEGEAFKEWGQKLLRKCLSEWARFRTSLREKQVKEVNPQILARINQLAPAYKDVAIKFVEKFKYVEMEPKEFEDILSWFLSALENATLRSILQRLRETDIDDLIQLDELLSKMEVRTATTMLQIIDSNLTAIETLEKMHLQNAQERGVLSKHLTKNQWLIDPTWMLSKAEGRVETWIRNEFNLPKSEQTEGDDDRADYFCIGVGGTLHIVEIKRGAHIATVADINQADKYRKYVLRRFEDLSDPHAVKYAHVQSHLVAAELHPDAQSSREAFADKGWVLFTTWDDLIERAKRSHNQYRAVLEKKATEENS